MPPPLSFLSHFISRLVCDKICFILTYIYSRVFFHLAEVPVSAATAASTPDLDGLVLVRNGPRRRRRGKSRRAYLFEMRLEGLFARAAAVDVRGNGGGGKRRRKLESPLRDHAHASGGGGGRHEQREAAAGRRGRGRGSDGPTAEERPQKGHSEEAGQMGEGHTRQVTSQHMYYV